ncbi:OsmC family protein [uncultured Ruegeria sp.]|uniref:OsmC family protein n=1 Tax=uncultured Ruegeria sp. TaxID=259304 RepID=UPI0026288E69|nr:OsmC family protein [uncultured Ruegeria sp.]
MATQTLQTDVALLDGASIASRQQPLRALYHQAPENAQISDHAATGSREIAADNPLYTSVTVGTGLPTDLKIGVHKAVGGESDYPVPGKIFAAAIASCLDSATRMIANLLGISLTKLEVRVSVHVDVRGTLMVDKSVPVGFQAVDVSIDIEGAKGVSQDQIDHLLKLAERSCVVLQTLQAPPEIRVKKR